MSETNTEQRKHWLSILPQTDVHTLIQIWNDNFPEEAFDRLRPAETGTAMVRGRMGGSGASFNMGEMTVTRATVRLTDGTVGFGYVAGRDKQKAELVALLDAVLQRDPVLAEKILTPMVSAYESAKSNRSRKAAATKVEFFTLVRGESPK